MYLSQGSRFEISLQRHVLQSIRIGREATHDAAESQATSRDPVFGSGLSLPMGSLCGWRQLFISLLRYCPNANPQSWSLHPAQKGSVLCCRAVGVFAGLWGQGLSCLVLSLHNLYGWDFAVVLRCKNPNKVAKPGSRRAVGSFPLQEYGMLQWRRDPCCPSADLPNVKPCLVPCTCFLRSLWLCYQHLSLGISRCHKA